MGVEETERIAFTPVEEAGESVRWAWKDDKPVHISTVPRGRQGYECPSCGGDFIARKGEVRTWHFAHDETDGSCPISSRESKAHYNTKMSLYCALVERKGAHLTVEVDCRNEGQVHHTGRVKLENWLGDWTDVDIERSIETGDGFARPDIVLYRGGLPIGGIEVTVSNRLTPTREEVLNKLGIRWIEIGPGSNLDNDDDPKREHDLDEHGKKRRTWMWDLKMPIAARRAGPNKIGCGICNTFEGWMQRRRSVIWNGWLTEIREAKSEGRCVDVWRREVRSSQDNATICELVYSDIVGSDGKFVARVLSLGDAVWPIASCRDYELKYALRKSREKYLHAQSELLRDLAQMAPYALGPWEDDEAPVWVPDA